MVGWLTISFDEVTTFGLLTQHISLADIHILGFSVISLHQQQRHRPFRACESEKSEST